MLVKKQFFIDISPFGNTLIRQVVNMNERDKEVIEFCKEAIRIPSPSGREKGVALLMKKKMEELGYDSVVIDEFGSCIGIINGSEPGKTILIDGHIDNVDVIDEKEWKHKPWGAEETDGKIYGRGTSDMKGSVCAAVIAAGNFKKDTGGKFKGRVAVSCTVHEECFEGISCRLVSDYVKPDCVIIGEATTSTVKIGQRGRAEVVVETEGISCHSSNPEKGKNAVYAMMGVIEEIRKIVPNEHPLLGKGILELTDIKSYPYPGASVVPSKCIATFDRRTLVGETVETILAQVDDAIERARKKDPDLKARCYIRDGEALCWTGATIKAQRYYPAWAVDEKSELVQKALGALKKAGIETKISHFSFCTNGSHFCGEKGIPTIGYGPSLESLAHVRDEYIEVNELTKAARGFEEILKALTE